MALGHDIITSERTQDIKISEDVFFESMLLSPNTLKGLKTSGFYVPSPIQLHGIPLGKCGFDLLLEAKSGTGKTAVFSVIALEKLNLNKGVQTLVLAPTREIASQIGDVIKTIGANFKGLSVEVVMGGLVYAEDVEKFKKNVHIVVGSPGRLYHLIKDKHIDVSSVRLVVLDEADKLLEKSFLSEINRIFASLPGQKQIIMSSATYPEDVKKIMSNYVQNPHHVCPDSSSVLLGIEQNVLVVPNHINIVKQTENRYVDLNKILSKKQFKQCLVFCNYQARVEEVYNMLKRDKWPVDKLHGQQQQTDRLEALKVLQDYQCRVLVTTDLAARGIDASNVDLVVNFEIPYDWQTYLHRIGRAGRYGSYGSAVTILCKGGEEIKFKAILKSVHIKFNLKYLWSEQPFLLDNQNIDEDNSHKEEESQHVLNNVKMKMGVKETYEKLWIALSDDSTQLKQEMHDIPTFERLCDSFEQECADTNTNNIESFTDLVSSFQNHEVKNKENFYYKPVKVNKMIMSSSIFNSYNIQQSFLKNKISIEITESNKSANGNDFKIKIDSNNTKNKTYNQLSKLSDNKKSVNFCRPENIEDNRDTSKPDPKVKNKEESCKPYLNGDLNGPYSDSKTNENFLDESNRNSNKTCYNNDASVHSNNCRSPEHNEDEKLLLALNLPTAFGKSKQKNSINSMKYKEVKVKKKTNKSYQNKRNHEYQVQHPDNKTELPKINVEEPTNDNVYESTTEDESTPGFEPLDGRNNYSNQIHYSKSLGKHNISYFNANNQCDGHSIGSNVAKERQHQFDHWYQQLQTQMQIIERSVYIQIMSTSHYY